MLVLPFIYWSIGMKANSCRRKAWTMAGLLAFSLPLQASVFHVAPGGDDANDGSDWGRALATISNAVDRASNGDTVMVANGIYAITAEIAVTEGITIRGTNGWEHTVIDGGGVVRCFSLSHADALLDGLSVSNGYVNINGACGAGVHLTAGTIRNSLIVDCYGFATGNGNPQGGGIWMSGGAVMNSRVQRNRTTNGSSQSSRTIRGGGIYMTGGLVTNCVINLNQAFRLSTPTSYGGGIWMNGGTVVDSTITSNRVNGTRDVHGGGVYMENGTLRQCYVGGNTADSTGAGGGFAYGGGVRVINGSVESCTIVGNASTHYAGGVRIAAGSIVNTIIYHNDAVTQYDDLHVDGGDVTYSCASDLTQGVDGNVSQDPGFEDSGSGYGYLNHAPGNYRLATGSPCRDAGANQAWMTTAVDFEGSNRIINATVDMGIYEAAFDSTLVCNFTADEAVGDNSLWVTFTAEFSGGNTDIIWYGWDFNNNGTFDLTGTDIPVVSNFYGVGTYDVHLRVTNSAMETATRTRADYITVRPLTNYVRLGGAPQLPFASWETAATNIQDALDAVADGGTVIVSNGTYLLDAQLDSLRAFTLQSVNGADVTIIDGGGAVRCLRVRVAASVVEGFTFTNGYVNEADIFARGAGLWIDNGTVRDSVIADCFVEGIGNSSTYGGGVYMVNGVLSGCVITGNRASNASNLSGNHQQGGGIYLVDGLITNCVISGNRAFRANPQIRGGGLFMENGLVTHSQITNNWSDGNGNVYGGGVQMTGGTLRNCLIAGNLADSAADGSSYDARGGGIYMTGGKIESCTLAGNESFHYGGGVFVTSGSITNTIIYENGAVIGSNNVYATGGLVGYSCATELTNGVDGNKTGHPGFVLSGSGYGLNLAYGDYRLSKGSIAIDAGMAQAWMVAAVGLDGTPRLKGRSVDMGAYEAQPPQGTLMMMR